MTSDRFLDALIRLARFMGCAAVGSVGFRLAGEELLDGRWPTSAIIVAAFVVFVRWLWERTA